ncbi:hydrolase [Spirochaeta lutea]|uniref:Hydrolase n=1 Tax=Spirochaeta lutea TaxID=1480694 RepID=A0A098QTC0_9SPIO|nr:hydrolase [Spirochaeta lutea]KGE70954.1 hydrolase [Spirochaeta lutea]
MADLQLGRTEFGRPQDRGNLPSPEQVRSLLDEWVPNDRLRLHMEQLGDLMEAWARRQGLDEQTCWLWKATGLLHDADWDRWPEEHCRKIIEYGEAQHWDPRLLRGIASHSPRHFGVDPQSELERMIYAFDELSGFVHAVSLVRPGGYEGMAVKSVKKKLKEKSFAAQVNREEIADAAQKADIPMEELIQFIIQVQAG